MRADRLVRMMMLLTARGRMTGRALADELEVSVRTVYRDVEALSYAGIPVYPVTGVGGGFELLDSYRNPLTGMSYAEAAAILSVSLPGVVRQLGFAEPFSSGQLKIAAGMGAHDNAQRFHIDADQHYNRLADVPGLGLLVTAVTQDRRVRVTCRLDSAMEPSMPPNWRSTTSGPLIVEPLGLVLKTGRWYLVGTAADDYFVRSVSAVYDLELLDDTFVRPVDFSLEKYWAEVIRAREQFVQQVTVRVARNMVNRLADSFGEAIRATLDRDHTDDEYCLVTLEFDDDGSAANRLAGFGSSVEVLDPPSIRDAIIENAREILGLYASSGATAPAVTLRRGRGPSDDG